MSGELVDRAKRFATQAHRRIDQRRKYSAQPYEVHLKAVAELVANVGAEPEVVAAAWLHDVAEDTPATIEDVAREFGPRVAALVAQLTDVSRPGDGNRARRKAIDREHLAGACAEAKTVKLADLIDNCRDICRHDPRFGLTFLGEMEALLEVLGEGDPRLLKRAVALQREWQERLTPAGAADDQPWDRADGEIAAKHRRTLGLFARMLTAADLAEPLRSFDAACPAGEARAALQTAGLGLGGVRRDGRIVGYVRADALAEGRCGDYVQAPTRGQVVAGDAPLTDVIQVLTRHEHCLIALLGEPAGMVERRHMQTPLVRMWLFGIVTFAELEFAERILARWPDGAWEDKLSPARLQKARELRAERERRGQPCSLLDCLQLSDKAQLLMADPTEREAFGFDTKGTAQRVSKELESLRNNLAHAQDIVAHDWPQIVRLTRRLVAIVTDC